MKERTTNQTGIIFILGFIAYIFSAGRWNLWFTAWIWPCAFLFVSRKIQTKKQYLLFAGALILGHVIKWANILDSGYILDALICVIWSVCWIVPFLADRLLFTRFRGILSTLIFPSVFVTLEILRTFTLVGSYGVAAYTQTGILPLVQVCSLTGSYGLSFLIWWAAPVILAAVRKDDGWKRTAAVYGGLMAAVLLFGTIRLFSAPEAPSVRVASVISPFYGRFSDEAYQTISYEESEAYFLSEAQKAKAGGADIACWNEESFDIRDTEEPAFLDTAAAFAKENDMVLIIGYEYSDTDDSDGGLHVNKSVIITPDGTVTDYIKTKLVPVMETSEYVKGTGNIPTVKTAKGILSNIICFDDSYIGYVHGFGASLSDSFRDTDILFVPSWDWYSVKKAHSDLAEFRAIENGEAVVKPTYDGITTVADRLGRRILRFDTDDTGFDTVQFADVPLDGVVTVYERFGTPIDFSFCLCGILIVLAALTRKKHDSRVSE